MAKKIPKVGESAPDFTVVMETGAEFNLKQALGAENNILLVFFRGHW